MKQFFTLLGIVAMGATAYAQADTDIVNIPDANFKRALVGDTSINTNGDTEISYGEAKVFTGKIDVNDRKINSLIGIEAFVNIIELDCSNNLLTDLNVSKNTKLIFLSCHDNQLTNLNISKNTELIRLYCEYNRLSSLDVSKNTALTYLSCYHNQLTNLDVSKNIELIHLSCDNNKLSYLDVSKNIRLFTLYCVNNQLSDLDVSKNTSLANLAVNHNELTNLDISKNKNLIFLNCSNNQLNNIDLSKNTLIETFYCSNNQLTQLNLANGKNSIISRMIATSNSNLTCIQIDSEFIPPSNWQKDDHTSYSDNCNYNLSTDEVKAENLLQILNPVKDNLIIKTTAKVEKIEIYNTAGQLVKVLFKGNTQVQDLAKGVYLVKITTDKGVITQKIIKQ